ncbi:hypothetical protein NDU88_005111 [Pleurodeles waltl]|uniref:Uncharacterized protein n=1 Tax=Pleurodeles waltl TaxID=8319 RepID=A0AAV7SKQ6_PLEWA|nr:hypothetical protein NDU88_005111 [Pleurodeles waltl]
MSPYANRNYEGEQFQKCNALSAPRPCHRPQFRAVLTVPVQAKPRPASRVGKDLNVPVHNLPRLQRNTIEMLQKHAPHPQVRFYPHTQPHMMVRKLSACQGQD